MIKRLPKGIAFALLLISGMTVFASSANVSLFKEIEKAAAQIHTMRDFHDNDEITYENGGCRFNDTRNFRKTRLVDPATFEAALTLFVKTIRDCLNKPTQWLGQTARLYQILDPLAENFLPHAQKLHLKTGDTFMCKPDLHGDVHSLIACIRQLHQLGYTSPDNEFKITDPHFFLIFLGDYVDKGLWGVEVLYLLWMLKNHNPDQVFLVRGNHEDPRITEHYGFKQEFFEKFNDLSDKQSGDLYNKIITFYEYLPLVLYVGSTNGALTDFVQCCHGGIEMGYNPKELLNSPLKNFETVHMIKRRTACCQKDFEHCQIIDEQETVRKLSELCTDFTPMSPMFPYPIGFLWHDFIVSADEMSRAVKGRGLTFDKTTTEATLAAASTEKVRLVAIIRAHQHRPHKDDPLMKLLLASKGCAILWEHIDFHCMKQNMVITLLVSPDTALGMRNKIPDFFDGFMYDTSLLITVGAGYSHWKPTLINNDMYSKRAPLKKVAEVCLETESSSSAE